MSKEVDAYIKKFPEHVQKNLQAIRQTVLKAAPEADELISYGMPAYKINGNILIYFAGYKNHIGLYATPSGHAAFEKELSKFKQGKGSVQFRLDEPLPFSLIRRIVQFRMKRINEKNYFIKGKISAPVQRALHNAGINTLKKLSAFTEDEILQLHGIGKTAIPIFNAALKEKGLMFKK